MSDSLTLHEAVAVALVLGQWDGACGDNVQQEAWDSLFAKGLLNATSDQTGERTPYMTAAGYDALIDTLRSSRATHLAQTLSPATETD